MDNMILFLLIGQGVDITKEIPAGYLLVFALVMIVVLRIARKVLTGLFLPRTMGEDDVPGVFAGGRKKKKGKGQDTDK